MISILLAACVLIIVTACGKGGLVISNNVEFGKEDYKKIITANNELGFKLLAEVEEDEDSNTFISPTSLFMALSMVYNGADGVTKDEIAHTLKLEGVDVEELNKANASLMSMLNKNTKQIQMDVANSIWLNKEYNFQDKFSKSNKDYFNAELQKIDASSSESSKKINDWVKKSTNGKISDIVEDPLDPNLAALLINAIYFKGNWTYEFDKTLTEKRAFYLKDGTITEKTLMSLNEEFDYMENEYFQAVTLPYGNKEMSMKVFLPKENVGLDGFKKILTAENWTSWNSKFKTKSGTIMLPKFQLEYEASLNETLKKLGMRSAFDESANFTKMIKEDDPLYISKVKQKTFIEVNEEGTEAAAVTSVGVGVTSVPSDGPFHMEVNRPFFITITDDQTDMILFMGFISNPLEVK